MPLCCAPRRRRERSETSPTQPSHHLEMDGWREWERESCCVCCVWPPQIVSSFSRHKNPRCILGNVIRFLLLTVLCIVVNRTSVVGDARETHIGSDAPYCFSLIYPDRLQNNTQISRDETAQMYKQALSFLYYIHAYNHNLRIYMDL